MAETRDALSEKLNVLEDHIRNDVHTAATKVAETVDRFNEGVDSAKATVHSGIESVKNACDMRIQVRSHPWAAIAGAAVAGYVGGRMVHSARHGNGNSSETHRDFSPRAEYARQTDSSDGLSADESSGALSRLTDTLRPELSMLRGLAIGVMIGLMRDVIVRSAPPTMVKPLGTIFDGLTYRMGGQPIPGRIVPGERARVQ